MDAVAAQPDIHARRPVVEPAPARCYQPCGERPDLCLSGKRTGTFSGPLPRSIQTESGPLTKISVTAGSLASACNGPSPVSSALMLSTAASAPAVPSTRPVACTAAATRDAVTGPASDRTDSRTLWSSRSSVGPDHPARWARRAGRRPRHPAARLQRVRSPEFPDVLLQHCQGESADAGVAARRSGAAPARSRQPCPGPPA